MPSEGFYYDGPEAEDSITCKRCGAEGLTWGVAGWDARGR